MTNRLHLLLVVAVVAAASPALATDCSVPPGQPHADSGRSWNLPEDRANQYGGRDYFAIVRPILSLHGFDASRYNGQANDRCKARGTRQVLEAVFGIDWPLDSEAVELMDAMIEESRLIENVWDTSNFVSGSNWEIKSVTLQSRAFLALLLVVMDRNPNIFPDFERSERYQHPGSALTLPSYYETLGGLRDFLEATSGDGSTVAILPDVTGGSPFKAAVPLMGLARILDLYFALENALCEYDNYGTANIDQCFIRNGYLIAVQPKIDG
jgi:hypothetical protein